MKLSGVIIVRIRESLPPDFVNQAVSQTVALLQADEFKNAVGRKCTLVNSAHRKPLKADRLRGIPWYPYCR